MTIKEMMTPDPDPVPTYDRQALPVGKWATYRKKSETAMVPIRGPFEVVTQEGPMEVPVGWEGFLAVDSEGHPYPISAENHANNYEFAGWVRE